MNTAPSSSFFAKHEFLIRRLHSLSGLIPVGAYMVVHLLVNASIFGNPIVFQRNVYQIHSLEGALVFVEWAFIFIPILFHAIFGVIIIRGGLPNTGSYPYAANYRYVLQRATGIIAFIFIMWHVFHTHGWFHFDAWMENVAEPLGGAQFKPYNAASSLAVAMQSPVVKILYAIGVLSCVFHLANGIWTMGITWGLWVSPKAQKRAHWISATLGIGLAAVSMVAMMGVSKVDVEQTRAEENTLYESLTESGMVPENEHKRYHESDDSNDGQDPSVQEKPTDDNGDEN